MKFSFLLGYLLVVCLLLPPAATAQLTVQITPASSGTYSVYQSLTATVTRGTTGTTYTMTGLESSTATTPMTAVTIVNPQTGTNTVTWQANQTEAIFEVRFLPGSEGDGRVIQVADPPTSGTDVTQSGELTIIAAPVLTLSPASGVYSEGQSLTVTMTGGLAGQEYIIKLYSSLPPGITNDLSGEITPSTSQSTINTISWGANTTSAEFYVRLDQNSAGAARYLVATNLDFSHLGITNSFTIISCPITVSITATPSLTIASGGSITLTASGASSYTWSNGSTDNPLILTNVTSASTLSVTGVTGICSATATVSVTSLSFCNTTAYVTPTGNGTKDGSSWANALPGDQFRQALATACSGTTFLVGGGLYKPTIDPTDRTATFRIPSGVEVYGGYTVVGGAATGRVISTSTGTPSSTTFSGDIDGNNTLDGTNSYNVVSLSNVSASTRLDGLVITGGYPNFARNPPYDAGGGVRNVASGLGNSSNPTITNCLFDANFGVGGGLYSLANEGTVASPAISNCRFANNIGPNHPGAALRIDASIAYPDGNPANRPMANPIITNTVFIQNTGFRGAAFSAENYFGDIRPTFTNCRFTGNTTTGAGGAMFWYGYTGTISVTAINCQFTDNTASDGGAVYADGCCGFENGEGAGIANISNTDFQSCTFTGNGATGKGGVLYLDAVLKGISDATLTNCVVSSNTATMGGAIYADASDSGTALIGITGSTFTDNRSLSDGGAIYSLSAVADVQSSTLTANRAGSNGGAIYSTGGSLTLTSSLVSQNTAAIGSGGGIYAIEGDALVLTQTDVVQNKSPQSTGGGVRTGNNLTITGGRINQNQSYFQGGGINFVGRQAVLTGVQISQNTVASTYSGGGGFAGGEISDAQFQSCTIAQNVSDAAGAGIAIAAANSLSVSNTLFDRNTGTSTSDLTGGGGFGTSNPLVASFSSCTFTGNQHNLGGGVSVPENSTLTVANSVFTGNVATSTFDYTGGGV